ncbi:tumor necrosis factor ligand superfamily member 10-like [Saccoglossus kowalevskii]
MEMAGTCVPHAIIFSPKKTIILDASREEKPRSVKRNLKKNNRKKRSEIIENAMKALGYIEISNQMADIRLEIDELTALMPRSNLSNISESHGTARTRTAAIHLTSGYGRFYSNKVFEGKTNTGMTIVGPWQVKSGIALKSGITTHDIGMCMVAPKHGIYHIYSQAYFQDEREDREYSNWNEYLHYTVLETGAYPDPITLMKSGRAEGIEKTPDLYYSSYHGGVFELRKGDKIFMKAYLPSSGITLDFRQESTFMGMFLVNEL